MNDQQNQVALASDPNGAPVRARPLRLDTFTMFTQVLAWGAVVAQIALLVYLIAV